MILLYPFPWYFTSPTYIPHSFDKGGGQGDRLLNCPVNILFYSPDLVMPSRKLFFCGIRPESEHNPVKDYIEYPLSEAFYQS